MGYACALNMSNVNLEGMPYLVRINEQTVLKIAPRMPATIDVMSSFEMALQVTSIIL